MNEYIILKLFGKKMLEFFFSKVKNKPVSLYRGFKKKQYNRKFVQAIDVELLQKYGDRDFYNELSKLVIHDNILNKIYNHCYNPEINKYQTSEEFLKELTSNMNCQCSEGIQIDEILKNIFDATFSIINQPELDDTRRILNVICDFRNTSLNNQEKILNNQNNDQRLLINIDKNINKLISMKYSAGKTLEDIKAIKQEQNEVNIFSDTVLQFYNDNKNNCNIRLSSKNDKPLFTITLTVKLTTDLANFPSFRQYFSYLMFTGKDDILDVVGIKAQSVTDGSIYANIEKEYCGSMCKLPPLYVYELESFPSIDEIKNMDMKIKIISPKDTFKVCLQNEKNEILFDSINYNISRKKLFNGELEITLNDTTNQGVALNIINNFKIGESIKDAKVISSKINICNINHDTAFGRLKYYEVLKRLTSANKIVFRNTDTGVYIGECQGIKWNKNIDLIDKAIEIYNQLITIQDYFNIKFTLPDNFDSELIDRIRQSYELISYGKTNLSDYTLTIERTKLDHEHGFKIGSLMVIAATFKAIKLLEQELNFENPIIISPKTRLYEITDDSYKFEPIANQYIILKNKCTNLEEIGLDKNLLEWLKQV